jgi:protein-S-isoprenylcysteine O-methyltransferase Ste14
MTRLPALGPRGEGWVLIQGILLVLVATAGWALGPDWSGPVRFAGIIVGILLIAGGVLLGVRAVADLGTALTPLPRPGEQAELIETGAFALVRHPIYGGLILAAFGWAVVQASIIAVALAAVLAAFFGLKSAREEAWLETRFAGYAAYRARTPRFIPRIGRSSG